MAPTLADQDRLIVNKLAYRIGEPRRGDIVMLYYPLNPDKSFVKRVIAEEGDTVRIVDGRVYVNDVPLRRLVRAARVPQPRRLGPAGDSRRLLLRDGRPPEQQLRQPPLGLRAEEVHHRQGAAPLVARCRTRGCSSSGPDEAGPRARPFRPFRSRPDPACSRRPRGRGTRPDRTAAGSAPSPAALLHSGGCRRSPCRLDRLQHVVDGQRRRRPRPSSASISTPVWRGRAHARLDGVAAAGRRESSTSTCVSGSGWHSGISSLVRLAAMMPARRAACSGSPFLTRAGADRGAAPPPTSRCGRAPPLRAR